MTNSRAEWIREVLGRALVELAARAFPLYTFIVYHDHESGAISVCADTMENSARHVLNSNEFSSRYFLEAVRSGNLKRASLWQANVGRSLSLGDFAAVNVARTDLCYLEPDDGFYLALIRGTIAMHSEIRALSPDPSKTLIGCSGPKEEVALVWTLQVDEKQSGESLGAGKVP